MDNTLKVIGSIGLSNTSSINIHEINDSEDSVVVSINNIKPRKHKLYYNAKGVYFNFCGSRNYLNNVLRIS